MSSQAIVDLKLRALELKKAGDVDGAKALLAQARDLEFQDVSVDDLEEPSALKRLAVALKKKGDLDGARAALAKAKRLESTEDAASVATSEQTGQRKQQTPAAHEASAESTEHAPQAVEDLNDSARSNAGSKKSGDTELGMNEGPVTFTDEEMLDADMMVEFKASGMETPSNDDYQAKILACKKVAVTFKKNGDIEKAKAALNRAKMFEVVMEKLNGDEPEDSLTEEDEAWLMQELNQNDSAVFEDLFGDDEAFDLDDLDDMDAEMLKVMMDAEMDVPTYEEVMDMSNEKKALAVGLKQAGNIVGAKAALVESKRLQSRAERLRELLDEIANGGDEAEGFEDLEKLLLPSEGINKAPGPKTQQPTVPAKSADELKQEVLKLRSEKKIKEATTVFKQYKQALAREAEAAELENRKKLISSIREEIRVATEQERLFLFYERFIDSEVGAVQLTQWNEYARKCAQAVGIVENKGSDSVDLSRSKSNMGGKQMLKIHNECQIGDVDFVGGCSDPTDERMEVAILSVLDMQENKLYKKMLKEAKKESGDGNANVALSVRVDVAIQLPPNEHNTDENINLVFKASSSSSTNNSYLKYDFGPSKYVPLPRGKSAYAKMIQRRMGRKRIQLFVHHIPTPTEKPSSWLKAWSSKPPAEEKQPVILGRVVLEMKEFLTRNAIAGDFPLADSAKKPVGGTLRLGVQVGAPFDNASSTKDGNDPEPLKKSVEIRPFSPMALAVGSV